MNENFSFLNDIHFVEYLYKKYKKNQNLVELSWINFFKGFDFGKKVYSKNRNNEKKCIDSIIQKEISVFNLIQFYKNYGHLLANTNPLISNKKNQNFILKKFGLSNKDLEKTFLVGKLINDKKNLLKDIIIFLENTFCKSIGIEYTYISDYVKTNWIETHLKKMNSKSFSINEKRFFLKKLNHAVIFEKYIHNKFIGQKRFSLEGNESILPMLEYMIEYSCNNYYTREFIIGMAHRGRLNILSNLLQKEFHHIFNEFYGKKYIDTLFSGDVKYHLGYHYTKKNHNVNKNIDIYLLPNPSHLESITPILEGVTRAKIDIFHNKEINKVIPILIHGDASISGQGIIYEVLQLSKLEGYKTGGTIHIIINNQIGFTTNSVEGRSSYYCTDIAKIVSSPVLHVNADDIESVVKSICFAIDFRMKYKEDIFIDLIGYRRHGHNEGDDPRFTQPIMYNKISSHPNSYCIYKNILKKDNIIDNIYLKSIEEKYINLLNKEYEKSKYIKCNILNSFLKKEWIDYPIIFEKKLMLKNVNTKFSKEKIIEISKKIFTLPKEKIFFKKIKSLFKKRLTMIENNLIDWSMAELLSYGTLLYEGFSIRISGEDIARGTFSQRHIIVKTEEEENIIILNSLEKKQGKIEVYNSPLSEYGVLGFDYGYGMISPNTLTLWEAQFGDFSNGAQIIIDQYIVSGETKWKIQNGIVLLLPHGYEGQGPEHSSARIERYIQLCANNNIFLANCTFPANFYHLLRRQMKLKFRKPLIVFTPKSLLRNEKCMSSIDDLSEGSFIDIVDDNLISNKNEIKRLILCSGKIYYDLLDKKKYIKNYTIAIIRIEQIYPLNIEKIKNIINKYNKKTEVVWVQEEPKNMGLWKYILNNMKNIIDIDVISPCENSSPSVGSYSNFFEIQNEILEKAFIFK
ncbi:2-oxoglutarate dehydrogenase E1 component [Blattabacterium cuenoti]|uniref:2-oxoglutarate dehydrogenase E1 component n=1 Tax=Blattabacterium cuenoti TaxID=1653831 RepID=UPI00163C85F3|nr:2-oxoglutarate dehydrogenase E1 component [Blattabacterium cuenoti]